MDLPLSVLECDGTKTLLGTADINTDDDGTRLVLIHADSRGRQDARYNFLFTMADGIME
jgi:hypothetical protein